MSATAGIPAVSQQRTGLLARLMARPDRERVKLRLGTLLIENVETLWPRGVPEDVTPDYIRDNIDGVVAMLDQMVCDGDVNRLPHQLHWLLWVIDELQDTG